MPLSLMAVRMIHCSYSSWDRQSGVNDRIPQADVVGPYAIGWTMDATGDVTLGLVVLAACSIMAGVVTFLMGHDSKMEMAG
jgi:hypothetical protein